MKKIGLKTGETIAVIEEPDGWVAVVVEGIRVLRDGDSPADCMAAFAAQFRTLAIELEHMAQALRGVKKEHRQ